MTNVLLFAQTSRVARQRPDVHGLAPIVARELEAELLQRVLRLKEVLLQAAVTLEGHKDRLKADDTAGPSLAGQGQTAWSAQECRDKGQATS
ncbi:MAG: hypothetical protein KJ947_22335 [Alphaproteobacteria bacterium]|nr:hypothetical protein [Alphaproteobacteria bacterium]MBU1552287.1 hypothetical protein [Alphaproteobacteria bacterium]MBU2336805.1 hypothetical protein [Alphaproteobacteria bacterium]MBU2389561.1 hypothetical protein [Alphaproteobacteria bacterium]